VHYFYKSGLSKTPTFHFWSHTHKEYNLLTTMMLHIEKEDSHIGVEAYDLEFYKGQVTEKARGGKARQGTWVAL
jgi:hypothetical protein